MKIGFDVSQTGREKAGCGYFADGLIRELAAADSNNEYILYPSVGDLFWDQDCGRSTFQCDRPNFRRVELAANFESSQSFWQRPPQDFEAQLGHPDIFHTNNFYCPGGLEKARLVYTLYDLSFLEDPEWSTEANRIGCFRGVFNAGLRADWIVAISEFTRQHFLSTFPHFPAERTSVIYPASRFHASSPAIRTGRLDGIESGRYWLSVATIEPRKNHQRLLEAYKLLRSQGGPTYPLVLAGGKGWLMEHFMHHLDGLTPGRDIILTGYVEDQELMWLYQNCFAFVYPSLFEGFGMPVLEAMAAGAAVICSSSSSLPEVAGAAGIMVDPTGVQDIAKAMEQLQANPEDRKRRKMLAARQAQQFSWTRAAAQLQEIYRNVQTLPRRDAAREPALVAVR